MKTIIAGSRTIGDARVLAKALEQYPTLNITEIVCGGAKGADTLGREYGEAHAIPVKMFFADWDNLGKKGGILRNEDMGQYADQLLALWDGESRGTQHMIAYMKKIGKPVYIYIED